MPVILSILACFEKPLLYTTIDTVGEFEFYAHIDVNNRLKLSIRNEFANGINYRDGVESYVERSTHCTIYQEIDQYKDRKDKGNNV
ncbi:MAG: hypothetical protein NVS4B1_14720 [Ktedonobacteraceae bacterium]